MAHVVPDDSVTQFHQWLALRRKEESEPSATMPGAKSRVDGMDAEVLKPGDDAGNRTVVKYSLGDGVAVYGIGVPQTWETSLGPTWSYVMEAD